MKEKVLKANFRAVYTRENKTHLTQAAKARLRLAQTWAAAYRGPGFLAGLVLFAWTGKNGKFVLDKSPC